MVNNIFTGLMLLPATKRHSILKLLVTASTLATAKGYETRPLRAGDSRLRFLVGLVAQGMGDDSYECHCHPSFPSIVRQEHDD